MDFDDAASMSSWKTRRTSSTWGYTRIYFERIYVSCFSVRQKYIPCLIITCRLLLILLINALFTKRKILRNYWSISRWTRWNNISHGDVWLYEITISPGNMNTSSSFSWAISYVTKTLMSEFNVQLIFIGRKWLILINSARGVAIQL